MEHDGGRASASTYLGLLTQYNAMEQALRGTPAAELHSPREMIGNALRGQYGEMLFGNEGE